MASSFLMFLHHTQRRTTVGRTPLDEWSVRHRDLYLTTHNTHNRKTSMPPVGFEPTISAGERPQLDRWSVLSATRIMYCKVDKMAACVSDPSSPLNEWRKQLGRIQISGHARLDLWLLLLRHVTQKHNQMLSAPWHCQHFLQLMLITSQMPFKILYADSFKLMPPQI